MVQKVGLHKRQRAIRSLFFLPELLQIEADRDASLLDPPYVTTAFDRLTEAYRTCSQPNR